MPMARRKEVSFIDVDYRVGWWVGFAVLSNGLKWGYGKERSCWGPRQQAYLMESEGRVADMHRVAKDLSLGGLTRMLTTHGNLLIMTKATLSLTERTAGELAVRAQQISPRL